MSIATARWFRAGRGGGRTGHHRAGARPRPTREERLRRQPRSMRSAASRAAKWLLPPAAALDSITPAHSTEGSYEPGLTTSLVPETTPTPQIPQPQNRAENHKAEIDLVAPPKTSPQRSPTRGIPAAEPEAELTFLGSGRNSARGGAPWSPEPNSLRRRRGARATAPMKASSEEEGRGGRDRSFRAPAAGGAGSEARGEEMGRRVGALAGLRFCFAAAAAWRARDTSREEGEGKRRETGGSSPRLLSRAISTVHCPSTPRRPHGRPRRLPAHRRPPPPRGGPPPPPPPPRRRRGGTGSAGAYPRAVPAAPLPGSAPQGLYPKRGETVELTCEALAFKGKGVCKVADSTFVLLCDGALPGERLLARVRRLRRGAFAEAAKLKTLEPHLDAVEAPCPLAADCGGCKSQSLAYAAQIRHKHLQVRDLLVNIGKFDPKLLESSERDAILKPIVPCDEIFRYRNKVLAVVQETWTDPALGLTPYDVHKHVGFLKHLMIRTGRNTSTGTPEVMVNFVTSCYKPDLLMPLVDNITKIPEVADVLYKLIEDSARLKGDGSEIVLDLFCGTGTIGLTLARRAKHVYGYEVVREAIADARKNAKLNGINNATFFQGDLNKINESFGKEFPKPDIIISDPNRPGMHMKLIKWLLEVKAPRIVYVS
ncbi:hypothetical protein C2845_PM07G37430 [Panicum miliaceum]|uniref:TRAM domain-containing protein n=1 Tax=Panicum miliaceum TaxID=4540 RepID=A0A3L6SIU7_PANMI|nr:hypothetical protein C2845_PM07G37430 [Panicum miliaceum]